MKADVGVVARGTVCLGCQDAIAAVLVTRAHSAIRVWTEANFSITNSSFALSSVSERCEGQVYHRVHDTRVGVSAVASSHVQEPTALAGNAHRVPALVPSDVAAVQGLAHAGAVEAHRRRETRVIEIAAGAVVGGVVAARCGVTQVVGAAIWCVTGQDNVALTKGCCRCNSTAVLAGSLQPHTEEFD